MRGEVNNTVAMREGWQRTISKRTASATKDLDAEDMCEIRGWVGRGTKPEGFV